MDMVKCPHCGEDLPREATFCPCCMEKLIEEKPVAISREKPGKTRRLLYLAALCVIAAAIALIWLSWPAAKTNQDDDIMVAAWTMKLRPHGASDAFNFCLSNSVVGFGWGLQGSPSTIKEYRTMRAQEGAYPGDTMLGDTLDSFENMTTPGSSYTHLVWTIDPDGNYYICEITGSYQYIRDEAHDMAGITNFADCIFYKVGSEDLVPLYIVGELEASGVIRFVHDAKAIEVTKQLWGAAREKRDIADAD